MAYLVLCWARDTDPNAETSRNLGGEAGAVMGRCAPSLWHRFQRGFYSGSECRFGACGPAVFHTGAPAYSDPHSGFDKQYAAERINTFAFAIWKKRLSQNCIFSNMQFSLPRAERPQEATFRGFNNN